MDGLVDLLVQISLTCGTRMDRWEWPWFHRSDINIFHL